MLKYFVASLAALAASSVGALGATEPPPDEVISFSVQADGVTAAGQVHRLAGTQPATAVVIVGGSGYRTRADAMSAVPLFENAETAVALYDRRGNGASTGSFAVPTTENSKWQIPRFASDVAAIAAHLKRAGYARVGLVGSSMGGWINVAAAATSSDIDFIVCMSGGASTVGVSDEFDRLTDQGMPIAEAIAAARRYRGVAGYDPGSDLRRMRQASLWIFGELDDSNPTALDAEVVRAFRAKGRKFGLIILPGTNHDFVVVAAGQFNSDWIGAARAFVATGALPDG